MTRRATFRGSPARDRARALYWLGVGGNLLCCLTFTALIVGFIIYAIDSLG